MVDQLLKLGEVGRQEGRSVGQEICEIGCDQWLLRSTVHIFQSTEHCLGKGEISEQCQRGYRSKWGKHV